MASASYPNEPLDEKPASPVAWAYVNDLGECEEIQWGGEQFDDPDVIPLYKTPDIARRKVMVKIKALEWGRACPVPDGAWSKTYLQQRIGHHGLGRYAGSYTVQEMEPGGAWGWWCTWTSDRLPEGVELTEEAARKACQNDFEARIRSVLIQPEGDAVLEEEAGTLADANSKQKPLP
jgi:hypothetical protein